MLKIQANEIKCFEANIKRVVGFGNKYEQDFDPNHEIKNMTSLER